MSNKIDIAFDIQGLTKKYGQVIALKNVSLRIYEGKITSIYGPNGAGKSTLVKILCGEEKNYVGKVLFRNKAIDFLQNLDALKAGISYMPQNFGLIPNLTGWENIAVPMNQLKSKLWYCSKNIELDTQRIDFNIDRQILYDNVSELTSYEKQLVAIFKALNFDSDIYIFDECTTNLNQKDFRNFSSILVNLKEQGKTIIFISHKIDEIFEISDNIIVLIKGQLISNLNKDLTSKEDIIKEFISDTYEIEFTDNKEFNKANYHIKLKCHNTYNIDFELEAGQIVNIETNYTAMNQSIAYKIYEWLTKQPLIVSGIIPGSRDTEGVFLNLSVKENLLMNAHQHKNSILISDNSNQLINDTVKKLDLIYDDWDQNISELSGGNQQKIVFGRWMIADFDIMVLIEPTAGIDLKSKEIIHDIILEMARSGKSFILITSDEGEKTKLNSKNIELTQLC